MRYKGVELHENEEVKHTIRQYPPRISLPTLLTALGIGLLFYLLVPLWNLHIWRWNVNWLGQFVFLAVLTLLLIYIVRAWTMFRGTILVVTNQRVIVIARRGFLEKAVSEVPYESLSDVSYRSKGLYEMMTGAGAIMFQMIGGKENVVFAHVTDAAGLHKHIMDLRISYAHGAPAVTDPVEEVMNTVQSLSPTERRALLTSMKKVTPRPKTVAPPPDAAE